MAAVVIEIDIEGTFDLASARQLVQAMRAAPPDADVHVDFGRVSELHDIALATLARTLAELGRRVTIGGLTKHQHRLLRYLGASADRAAEGRAAGDGP